MADFSRSMVLTYRSLFPTHLWSSSRYLQSILHLLHGFLRVIQLIEKHKRPPEVLIQHDTWHGSAAQLKESRQLSLIGLLIEIIQPDTVGSHALAKAKLNLVLPNILAVQRLTRLDNAVDVRELEERKGLGSLGFLDLNVLQREREMKSVVNENEIFKANYTIRLTLCGEVSMDASGWVILFLFCFDLRDHRILVAVIKFNAYYWYELTSQQRFRMSKAIKI